MGWETRSSSSFGPLTFALLLLPPPLAAPYPIADKMAIGAGPGKGADNPINRLVEKDTVPWYKKPNLRTLYFLMFPTCIGIEMTSGLVSRRAIADHRQTY